MASVLFQRTYGNRRSVCQCNTDGFVVRRNSHHSYNCSTPFENTQISIYVYIQMNLNIVIRTRFGSARPLRHSVAVHRICPIDIWRHFYGPISWQSLLYTVYIELCDRVSSMDIMHFLMQIRNQIRYILLFGTQLV